MHEVDTPTRTDAGWQVTAVDVSGVSGSDFYAASYYREALNHPAIQRLKEKDRVNAIAELARKR